MTQVPVAEGLFAETAGGPRLFGSRCATCGTPYFPKVTVCRAPTCNDSKIEDAELGPHGTLWSYTIQHYPPPPPAKYDEPYQPYAMGMVDLDDGLRVLTRFSTDNVDALRPGMPVELVIERLYADAKGNEVLTWKFRPI
jgi:uncharacterized OB-fold protein